MEHGEYSFLCLFSRAWSWRRPRYNGVDTALDGKSAPNQSVEDRCGGTPLEYRCSPPSTGKVDRCVRQRQNTAISQQARHPNHLCPDVMRLSQCVTISVP